MAVRSTWQILTAGWGGKLAIDMMTPFGCDLILQFVIASCVARGETIEAHNWNRIANAENKKKKVCDLRGDARTDTSIKFCGGSRRHCFHVWSIWDSIQFQVVRCFWCYDWKGQNANRVALIDQRKTHTTINNRRLINYVICSKTNIVWNIPHHYQWSNNGQFGTFGSSQHTWITRKASLYIKKINK